MNKNALRTGAVMLTLFTAASAFATTGTCEATGNFTTQFSNDWAKDHNVAGTSWPLIGTPSGSNYQLDCDCPAGTKLNVYYSTISALTTTGQLSGFYRLNDSLDIKTEITGIPGADIALVPTPSGSPIRDPSGSYSAKSNNSVCTADPQEQRAPAVSYGSNVNMTLYVTKPFLGELVIPDTHIATIQAAWSDSSSYPKAFKDIAELHIQGRITVPQSCTINQGDTVQVHLGFVNASRFTTKDQMPDGYTPVIFDIAYNCGDMSAIKNSLYMNIEGNDVASQYVLTARRRESDNVPDVGIRMVDVTNGNVNTPFTAGQILLDGTGTGNARFQAYPVNLVGGPLSPGTFKGTATITILVK